MSHQGFNTLAAVSKLVLFFFIPHCLSSPSCINEYLAPESSGY